MNRRLPILTILALLAAGSVAAATGPQVWMFTGANDFGAGETEGTSIDAEGAVRLAPGTETLLESPEPRLWSMAPGDGAIYVAVGERGRVLRVGPGEEPTVLFEVEELGAQALEWGPDGHLYVAAGPRGGIYRVPPDHDGSALDPWYVPEATYVWDMAFAPDGTLWVATGADGKILRVAADGAGQIVYDTDELHVTSLAVDGGGRLLAGTDGSGLVYRISEDGDVFVLYDSPMREITDLLAVGDRVWAATFGTDATDGEGEDSTRASRAGGTSETSVTGAVYELEPDGYARELWRSESEGAYALASLGDSVLIGTGDGALRSLDPAGRTALVTRTGGDQVVALEAEDGGVLVATSNPGRVLRMGTTTRSEGLYRSPVRDAGTISRWGAIRWHATVPEGASLRLSSRSGNAATPDDTWSDWSEPYRSGEGSPVASPAARFIQWRAELGAGEGGSPRLHRVELAYVTRNLAPRIDELIVHPAGVVYRQNTSFEDGLPFAQLPPSIARELRDNDPSAGAATGRAFLGRPFWVAARQTLSWQASDPNDDLLSYRLEFRQESDREWRPLAGPLRETQYVLDTRRLPDGVYQVRLAVDDASSRSPEDALGDERVSRPFRVDNTPPEVVGLTAEPDGDRIVVRGRVADRTSLIQSLHYSVDGGEWRTVVPADGVADSAQEGISIVLEALSIGEHVVVVRAIDGALNEGAGRIVVQIS